MIVNNLSYIYIIQTSSSLLIKRTSYGPSVLLSQGSSICKEGTGLISIGMDS